MILIRKNNETPTQAPQPVISEKKPIRKSSGNIRGAMIGTAGTLYGTAKVASTLAKGHGKLATLGKLAVPLTILGASAGLTYDSTKNLHSKGSKAVSKVPGAMRGYGTAWWEGDVGGVAGTAAGSATFTAQKMRHKSDEEAINAAKKVGRNVGRASGFAYGLSTTATSPAGAVLGGLGGGIYKGIKGYQKHGVLGAIGHGILGTAGGAAIGYGTQVLGGTGYYTWAGARGGERGTEKQAQIRIQQRKLREAKKNGNIQN